MIQKGNTYTKDGKKYTVLSIGNEEGEDGPNVILKCAGKGGRSQNVVKSLRQVVNEIASTLTR